MDRRITIEFPGAAQNQNVSPASSSGSVSSGGGSVGLPRVTLVTKDASGKMTTENIVPQVIQSSQSSYSPTQCTCGGRSAPVSLPPTQCHCPPPVAASPPCTCRPTAPSVQPRTVTIETANLATGQQSKSTHVFPSGSGTAIHHGDSHSTIPY